MKYQAHDTIIPITYTQIGCTLNQKPCQTIGLNYKYRKAMTIQNDLLIDENNRLNSQHF